MVCWRRKADNLQPAYQGCWPPRYKQWSGPINRRRLSAHINGLGADGHCGRHSRGGHCSGTAAAHNARAVAGDGARDDGAWSEAGAASGRDAGGSGASGGVWHLPGRQLGEQRVFTSLVLALSTATARWRCNEAHQPAERANQLAIILTCCLANPTCGPSPAPDSSLLKPSNPPGCSEVSQQCQPQAAPPPPPPPALSSGPACPARLRRPPPCAPSSCRWLRRDGMGRRVKLQGRGGRRGQWQYECAASAAFVLAWQTKGQRRMEWEGWTAACTVRSRQVCRAGQNSSHMGWHATCCPMPRT